ncbi:MAG TPA: hypothetical protein VLT45_10280 [Kofleriaceae bacterium]|nr:hypothetical protein [Kofleriaceae bacterium]
MTRAKAKPGTERYRDERRSGGGPRMHGQRWHDHDQPHDVERLSGGGRPSRGPRDAGLEGAEERQGMGKHTGRKDKGASRVDERTARGKGIGRSKSLPPRARSAQRR